jgi:hypothetical protein
MDRCSLVLLAGALGQLGASGLGLLGRLLLGRLLLGGLLGLLGGLGALATRRLLAARLLLGQQRGVDVGQHTSLGDGNRSQKLVELLVVAGRQLDVAGHDARALGVARGIAGQLQELGAQVLHHTGQVHGGTAGHTGRVAAAPQITRHTAHRERESRTAGAALRLASLGLSTSSLSFARHCSMNLKVLKTNRDVTHNHTHPKKISPAMDSSCTRHFSRDIPQSAYEFKIRTF